MTHRRDFLKQTATLAAAALLPNVVSAQETLPMPTWQKLPRWRGFNLLEKFISHDNNGNPPFVEDDFRWIRDWGFNFVRLPMSYHTWIVDGDRTKFREKTLCDIDKAVDYGQKYGIHILMNFHRAPGYTVARPQEPRLVWDDDETLDVCALHWQTFARRYRGVSNRYLSFNLFNEPANVEIDKFMKVHRRLCEVIRAESPDRLILCDGMSWGTQPTMELLDLQVAQATRGYMPMEISHYQASWVGDAIQNMKIPPTWPLTQANGMLFSPTKPHLSPEALRPIRFTFTPECGKTRLRLHVGIVSTRADLEVVDSDRGKTLWEKSFRPGPGAGEWKEAIHKPEWNCYQNLYDRDYFVEIPAGVEHVEIRMLRGDWIQFEHFGFQGENAPKETMVATSAAWNIPALCLTYDGTGVSGLQERGKQWHYDNYIVPWKKWEAAGGGVMVGEFGAYCKTPHAVVLAWMEDLLSNWKDAGWGWALWNLRGSIGILDSRRQDVDYVDFHGHKLDRKMLDLLLRY